QSWVFTARGNRMHAITHKTWDDGYVIHSDSFYVRASDTTLYTIHF
ncbi:MAG: hypothetical protein IT269_14085, partial [Saprospiraceae bacterium]|nr:hypothetical protein [Saprospiraceae bacterium]